MGDASSEEERYTARLICDLRKGQINIRLPHWAVNYGTIDIAITRIPHRGWLFVVDLADAFLSWKVKVEDTLLLGFYSPIRDQYGRFLYFPFGLSTAPAANDDSLKEILRLLELREGIQVTDFVDDLLGVGADRGQAWGKIRRLVAFLLSAGIPVSTKPTGLKEPTQNQVWIGWAFDSVNGLVSVTLDKCSKCQAAWTGVLWADDARTLRARQLAAAAGLASHVAEVFVQGRRRLHHIWADKRGQRLPALD